MGVRHGSLQARKAAGQNRELLRTYAPEVAKECSIVPTQVHDFPPLTERESPILNSRSPPFAMCDMCCLPSELLCGSRKLSTLDDRQDPCCAARPSESDCRGEEARNTQIKYLYILMSPEVHNNHRSHIYSSASQFYFPGRGFAKVSDDIVGIRGVEGEPGARSGGHRSWKAGAAAAAGAPPWLALLPGASAKEPLPELSAEEPKACSAGGTELSRAAVSEKLAPEDATDNVSSLINSYMDSFIKS